MKARWLQGRGASDYDRAQFALAHFRSLFPKLPAPNILLLANLALDVYDNPARWR